MKVFWQVFPFSVSFSFFFPVFPLELAWGITAWKAFGPWRARQTRGSRRQLLPIPPTHLLLESRVFFFVVVLFSL